MENQETSLPPYTDYRIGNIIYYKPFSNEIKTIHKLQVIDITLDLMLKAKSISPVPISEELLLKTNYIKQRIGGGWLFHINWNRVGVFVSENENRISVYANPEGLYENSPISQIPHIKYFHQLQNLYYILEGKELQIKL